MRAVVVTEPGGPEQLQIVERPVPAPGPGELLVRVRATSVNRADLMQRQGRYPPPPGAGDVLGLEAAGEVVEIGPEVGPQAGPEAGPEAHPEAGSEVGPEAAGWRPGDRVAALLSAGGYAQYATVAASTAMRVPEGMSWTEAGGLAEVFCTAYDNVLVRGRLRAGETLLVNGASSGVGTAAVQLAVRAGARVLGTASSAAKLAAAADLGAFAGIDYTTEDFVERVRTLTGGRGVDVILDMVGGPYLQRNLEALAPEGRLVVIGLQGGASAELPLLKVLQRRLTVTGSTMRARSVAGKAAVARGMATEVLPGFADGSLRVVVDRVFHLEEVADAHRAMEAGAHIGKIVLEVS